MKNSPVIAICPPPVPSPGPGNSVRGLDLDLLLFVTSAGLLAANNTGWGKVKGPSKQASLWCRLQIFLSCPSFYRRGEGNPPTSIWQRVDRGLQPFFASTFSCFLFLQPVAGGMSGECCLRHCCFRYYPNAALQPFSSCCTVSVINIHCAEVEKPLRPCLLMQGRQLMKGRPPVDVYDKTISIARPFCWPTLGPQIKFLSL